MITISEFSPSIYLIKLDNSINLEELKQVPEVVKLISNGDFEFKLDDHGFWILHLKSVAHPENNNLPGSPAVRACVGK
jgi:hypothetical protein